MEKIINLKEYNLKNNTYEDIKYWIEEARKEKNNKGYLAEIITYIYYYCIKDYEIELLKKMKIQNDIGDFFIYDDIQPFCVDSKSSHLYNNLPKAWIDLTYWKYQVGYVRHYGINVIKNHNYGWLYELKHCNKLFYYNEELKQCFIVEDFQAVRNNLLNNYLTKKMRPKEVEINNFNYMIDNRYKPCKAIEICEKREKLKEFTKVTEGLAILLTEKVINALGSELTIIQLEY